MRRATVQGAHHLHFPPRPHRQLLSVLWKVGRRRNGSSAVLLPETREERMLSQPEFESLVLGGAHES